MGCYEIAEDLGKGRYRLKNLRTKQVLKNIYNADMLSFFGKKSDISKCEVERILETTSFSDSSTPKLIQDQPQLTIHQSADNLHQCKSLTNDFISKTSQFPKQLTSQSITLLPDSQTFHSDSDIVCMGNDYQNKIS